jgi:hypothetical protein
MRSPRSHPFDSLAAMLAAVLVCFILAGCASTDDSDNVSERPWNAPRNWESGLPGGMMEGR